MEKGDLYEYFEFVRMMEAQSLIKKVSVILLFEELFECSPAARLEEHFEIF